MSDLAFDRSRRRLGGGDRVSRFFADARGQRGRLRRHIHLDDSFAWLGTRSALIMLGVAALAEVLAYYIPVIDNLLDVLATPAAFIAGTIVSAAVITDAPPMVKWTAAVVAGGGVAGSHAGGDRDSPGALDGPNGRSGNSIIATAELGGVLLISFLALAAPAVAVCWSCCFCWRSMRLPPKRKIDTSARAP